MRRYAASVDENQPEIVKALRKVGATVQILSAVGQGCPDILAGFRDTNVLMEIKDGSKSPSMRKLTGDEMMWHARWRGQVCVVHTVDEALAAIGIPTICPPRHADGSVTRITAMPRSKPTKRDA